MCLIRKNLDILTPLEVQCRNVLLYYIRLNKCYIATSQTRVTTDRNDKMTKY